jgi:hypothetical protein
MSIEDENLGRSADEAAKGLIPKLEHFWPRSINMDWICRIFGGLISVEGEQLSFI